ncbi:helix-turn-helix domain-containing protein [Rhizobium leguminosarum]|uniref:helix-turn-helix domain-containing protein n=1 Tax=Rhizobium TaxID=379 RepID=UPI00103014EB|nr:helix-turn-helix domain-containing protein [Rhizobium leguminosarum]TBH13945.1 transcriptional regulator [Rhizobium leguminosarum]
MLTAEQVRAARALLRMEQRDLAERSGVSLPSIKRLEQMNGSLTATRVSTVEAIRAALEAAGVTFIAENGGGPGVRLSRPPHGGGSDS